jgi:hypothetical protein
MNYIITFLCIRFEVFSYSFFEGDPVIEWMSERSRIGDDPNNTEFESDRKRESWVKRITRDIEDFKERIGKGDLTDIELKRLQCREFRV